MTWKWERPLEELKPAKLVVTNAAWWIEAYWPGPDNRYSGTRWEVAGLTVPAFAEELVTGWKRLLELEDTAPIDAKVSVDGPLGSRVVLRGYPGRGITCHKTDGLIATEGQLANILKELSKLKDEAQWVQQLFDRTDNSNSKPQLG